MCLFFRCTIINVEMSFAFTIRIGDEFSRLMEHLLVLLDELRQKLTEIILREAYNQECSNDNINGDTIRAVERPVEFLHAIIMQLSFFVANQCHLIVPRIAEAVFGEELEVIQTYISDDPPADANQAVWYLGESIKKMAAADYFIGIYDEEKAFRGCAIENLVARSYNIPSYVINFGFVAPDVTEARAKANRKYNRYY